LDESLSTCLASTIYVVGYAVGSSKNAARS
jgi:hypothetical protein